MTFDVGTRRGSDRLQDLRRLEHQVGYATMLVSESYNFSIEICMNKSHLVTISNSTLVKKDLPGRTDHVICKVCHTIFMYHFDSS